MLSISGPCYESGSFLFNQILGLVISANFVGSFRLWVVLGSFNINAELHYFS